MVVLSLFAALLSASSLVNAGNGHGHGHNSPLTDRIKRVVVLVLENRSFDTVAGGFTYSKDIDNLVNTKYCNPANVSNPSQGTVCATPTLPNIDANDPNHSISGANMEVFGTYHPTTSSKETMQGFVTEQALTFPTNASLASQAILYWSETDLPVLRTLAENYVLFDKWFCAVPGPTNPNRAYITSGTSHGHGSNDAAFDNSTIPQRSIFQQLSENGISWINYSNTSGFLPDALFYSWTVASGADKTNVKPLAQFYNDAKAGTLPQFTYINPECCSVQSFHPPSSATDGETFVKQIYEALRASPQWEETLFILTFDENGGFGDHVPPPTGVPAGDSILYTETAADGKPVTFDFTRLGIRVPAMLISPWVGKGVIEHEGTNSGGVYTHTSIAAFVAHLWGLDYLTPRVAWSSTFEKLILEKSRETIETLPAPHMF
jgi:phospholipase C